MIAVNMFSLSLGLSLSLSHTHAHTHTVNYLPYHILSFSLAFVPSFFSEILVAKAIGRVPRGSTLC